jgi:hypothetical protein
LQFTTQPEEDPLKNPIRMRVARLLLGSGLAVAATLSAAAAPASAAPHAVTGYHVEGAVTPNGENKFCVNAVESKGIWYATLIACNYNTPDATETWVGMSIYNVLHLSLAGHPDLVLAGIPGAKGAVELLNTKGTDVPFPQTLNLGGKMQDGKTGPFTIYNIHREYVAAPDRGRGLLFVGRILPLTGYNRSFTFHGFENHGWIAETEL